MLEKLNKHFLKGKNIEFDEKSKLWIYSDSKEIFLNKSGSLGKELSKDHKKNISLSKKGCVSPNKGKEFTEKHKKNLSLSNKGEKCYNWQGGKSFEPYGIEFNNQLKEQIRKRDNYRCQECGFNQKQLKRKLSIHHIDFNKQNNNPNNLISLCNTCHTQTNFNKKGWIEYFQDKTNREII